MRLIKKHLALLMSFFVVFCMVASVTPYADTAIQSTKSQRPQIKPQQRGKPQLRRTGKNFKIKRGAEVAAKVRKLKESDRDVRAALKHFEDKKRMPKIDDSFAITGSLAPMKAQGGREGATLQKAGFLRDSSINGTDVELIFV